MLMLEMLPAALDGGPVDSTLICVARGRVSATKVCGIFSVWKKNEVFFYVHCLISSPNTCV
jgi:hypothetical protein